MTDLQEINALIAEHVLGKSSRSDGLFDYSREFNSKDYHQEPFPYSSDITAAWEVVEKLVSEHYQIIVSVYEGGASCDYGFPRTGTWTPKRESAATVPLAICLAALKAKGITWD